MLHWVEQTCVLLDLPGGGLGSGGIVGEGLVLTALHNVFDPGECTGTVPEDVPMPQVRALGDLMGAFRATGTQRSFDLSRVDLGRVVAHPLGRKLATRMVWPVPGTQFGDFDVAILEVTDAVAPDSAFLFDAASYDVADLDRQEVSLWGCGFPAINLQIAGASQTNYRQHKIISGTSARETSTLTPAALLKVSSPNPRSAQDWAGVSGSLVWVDAPDQRPRLAGVINEAVTHALDNDELYFTDILKLAGQDGFEQALRRDLNPVKDTGGQSLGEIINHYKCELDRDLSRGEIEDWLIDDFDVADPQAPPSVIVIPVVGHTFDEPALFVRTCLHLFDLETTLPLDQGAETFSLSITPEAVDFAFRRKALLRTIGRRYTAAGRRGTPKAEDLALAMADPTHPRVMVVEHTGPAVTDVCEKLVGEVLSIASLVRPGADPSVPFLPMLVFLSFVTGVEGGNPDMPAIEPLDHEGKPEQINATLERLKAHHGTLAWGPAMPALNQQRCNAGHVANWLDEMRNDNHEISTAFEDTVSRLLESQSTFPIRFADTAIRQALKQVS